MKTWEWMGDGARARREPGEHDIRARVVERYGNGLTSATYAFQSTLPVRRATPQHTTEQPVPD